MKPRGIVTFQFLVCGVVQTAAAPDVAGCIKPGGTSWLDCITEAGTYNLPPGNYVLDRHFQLPDNVSIIGAGTDKTTIEAERAVYNGCGAHTDHPGDSSTRIGFVLGNNCYIGKFMFVAKDDHRWQGYNGAALCGGAVFETPGCADAYCESENIGEGHGDGGVSGITVEDVVIRGSSPDTAAQLAVFVTQTKDLTKPTRNVNIRGIDMNHSWADGINLHGAVTDATVENCVLGFQGDDNLAVWSYSDLATRITFRNNSASQAQSTNPNKQWGNCVALYGGGEVSVIDTQCYHTSNGGVKMATSFGGEWGADSHITVQGMVTDDGKPACTGQPQSLSITGCENVPPEPLPGWIEHAGTNCYQGHGANVIQPEPYSRQISLAACMEACVGASGCEAVVFSDGACYLRANVQLEACDQGSDYDTWMAPARASKRV